MTMTMTICPTYPEKFTRDICTVFAPFLHLSVVIVTPPPQLKSCIRPYTTAAEMPALRRRRRPAILRDDFDEFCCRNCPVSVAAPSGPRGVLPARWRRPGWTEPGRRTSPPPPQISLPRRQRARLSVPIYSGDSA